MSTNKGYTKGQIKFIMNLKKRGKTYSEIATQFGKKYGIKKTASAVRDAFTRYKDDYDLDGLKSHVEVKVEIIKERMITSFLKMVGERKYIPIQAEYASYSGYSGDKIRRHFDSFENLENLAREKDPKIFRNIIDPTSFNATAFKALREDISKYKRLVITAAVTGCTPHEDGMASIKNFCKRNKSKLLILPCSDPAHTKQHKYDFSLHHTLPLDCVVFKDLSLNSNLFLSTIKVSAKQLKPLTGLKRVGQRGSFIFASPKQSLEHIATSNKKGIPRAMMTTGVITKADYNTDRYMSERTAYLASDDHKLGAIIVEIKDNRTFFYRRIQIDSRTGAFTDINKKYFPDGSMERVGAELAQLPDWHTLSVDPKAKKAFKEIVSITKPKYLTLEDFFDGLSINHHERHKYIIRAQKAMKGQLDLASELKACSAELDDLAKWPAKEIVLKYGNHEDFLWQWLDSAEYARDPHNKYEGVCLAKVAIEGEMPFEHAMRVRYPFKTKKKVTFLRINDSFKVNGIENGVHGHLGAGGKRSPGMEGLETYGPCNTGHNHSAAIQREVCRVGTATLMQLIYNDGASAWTHTMLLQHYDASRQLITAINGEWCLPDILK